MTKLLYAATPAGNKALLMLEELGIDYSMQHLNVSKGIQKTPEYKNLVPTGKIPAIIENGKTTFESGAILISLAQKHNKFIPLSNSNEVLSWFFWESSEFSPKFLQHYRTKSQNPESTEIIEKIETNLKDLLAVLNTQLNGKSYIAGEFSIVDISAYHWLKHYVAKNSIPHILDGCTNVQTWLNTMDNRDAVKSMNKIASDFSWEAETTIAEIEKFFKA